MGFIWGGVNSHTTYEKGVDVYLHTIQHEGLLGPHVSYLGFYISFDFTNSQI